MRICELNLLAFGAFTDTLIDLTSGEAGLQIIYGPNESGKTTSLRAIQSLLFGFPHTSRDGFLHSKPKVAGTLQSASGKELSFVRRKGRKNTLLHPVTEAAVPESELQAFLGGVDRDTFEDVFAIDHVRMVQGGEELRQLRGLVGESLYTAALGGARLVEVMAQLTKDAQDIFDTRKKCRIREAEKEFKQALVEKKEATIPFSRWERLHKELAGVAAARQQTMNEIQRLRTEEKRIDRIRRSLRLLSTRSQLRQQLDQIGAVELLPESYSAADRIRTESALDQANQRIHSLRERLEGEQGLRHQQAALQVSTLLLENEEVIRDLQERLGAHLKASRDCESKLRPQLEHGHARIKQLLADFDTGKSLAEVDQLRISSNRLLGIQNLASEEKQVRAEPGRIAAQCRKLQQALTLTRKKLTDLGETTDTTRLAIACDVLRHRGDFESERRGLRESWAALESTAQQQLAALGLWKGDLADVSRLAVPLRETVERFDQDLATLQNESQRLAEKGREIDAELAEIRRELKALRDVESVPTEAELTDLRRGRNEVWQRLRHAILNRDSKDHTDSAHCENYEGLVAAADAMADRLRREAGRVQKLAQLQAREHDLKSRRQRLDQDNEACQQRIALVEVDWRERWAPCGMQPLSPREMLAWLNRFAEVQRTSEELAAAKTRHHDLQAWVEEQSRHIGDCLRQLGEDVTDASLMVLAGRAEKLIQSGAKQEQQRAQLRDEIARLELELGQAKDDESATGEKLKAWQEKWTVAMNELGCPAEATAEQANQRIAKLDELSDHVDEVRALESRIEDIEKEGADFARRVRELVSRVASDLGEQHCTIAAGQLQQRLEEARRADQEHTRLAEEITAKETELADAMQNQQSLQKSVTRFCEWAGVNNVELLPGVEQSSSEYRECSEKLTEIEEQLQELGAGMAVEDMVRDAADQNVDQLDARLTELATEIESLERTRDEQTSLHTDLQSQCDATDGRANAAEADGRALGILSRMHEDAEQFLRLRLAAVLLRQQIERHRSENEDPILAKASDFFARMTGNEFLGLRTEYESDEAVIVGQRRNDQLVDVGAMSTGTRDQLYLALRLAYLQRRIEQHEPLPFIVDDVLVHFDDERAGATLEVLAEVARQTQVILFTHHQRITDLAEQRLSKGTRFVHRLDHAVSLQTM